MIRHLVLWNLTDEAKAQIQETAEILDKSARNMVGKIPGLLKSEVRVNQAGDPHELILYSEFESPADLKPYIDHPVHQKHRKLVHTFIQGREVADIEA
ncbi:MAG: Dabb family protein [Treponema sp.]|jgi:antibiotic biosynthesis monooxygenase (ABM) superfamily enzyme|nr:Dabb family protein [Treponema sp.]